MRQLVMEGVSTVVQRSNEMFISETEQLSKFLGLDYAMPLSVENGTAR